MAAKNVDIKINTTASGNGAKQTAADMDKLAASSTKAAAATNTVTTSSSKLGAKAGALGLQLQDIAVQAQSGTSAVTILAQQGTQIASIFGLSGAVVGALLAVGTVAAKVFYDMAKASAVTGEAMEDMSDKLKEAFSDQAKKMVEEFNQELKNQTSFAQSLRTAEIDLMEARIERGNADAKLIESQAALESAAVKYLDATGQIVNAEKALASIRNEAAAAQKDAQIAEIEGQVEVARARYVAFTKQYEDLQGETDRARQRLAELQAQEQTFMSDLTFSQGQDKRLQKAGALGKDEVSQGTRVLQGELDSIRTQIKAVYDVINSAPQKLQEISQQSIEAATQLDIAISGAQTQIQTINDQFNLTQSAEALTTATSTLTEGAKQIQQAVDGIDAITPVQQQAKAEIQKALEDGKITAEEQVKIGQSLSILLSTLQSGQGDQIKTIQKLIDLNNTFKIQMDAMQAQIDQINQKRKSPTGIQ